MAAKERQEGQLVLKQQSHKQNRWTKPIVRASATESWDQVLLNLLEAPRRTKLNEGVLLILCRHYKLPRPVGVYLRVSQCRERTWTNYIYNIYIHICLNPSPIYLSFLFVLSNDVLSIYLSCNNYIYIYIPVPCDSCKTSLRCWRNTHQHGRLTVASGQSRKPHQRGGVEVPNKLDPKTYVWLELGVGLSPRTRGVQE